MKRFYLPALAAALAFTGCVKVGLVDILPPPAPEPELTVEQTDYTLGAFEERTATAAFTAKGDWTLSIVYDNTETGDETGDEAGDEADADAAWLTADAAGGAAGEQSVQLTARLNFTEISRTAYVDLVCGEQSVRLTVTQTGLSGDMDFSALFDPTFAQKLQELGIVTNAEQITLEEMKSMAVMTELEILGTSSIPGTRTSLQGIEYFESLTTLRCIHNQLTTLDVSGCTALTYLECTHNNQLTTLDVSGCTKLTYLECFHNQLTSLDVSKNTALGTLFCNNNPLTSLDVSGCTALMMLDCANNQLTSLDVSQNTALTDLDCTSNPLTSLDVSKNKKLTRLVCYSNPLTTLDVSQNTALTILECSFNQLTSLDVSQNTALTALLCSDNQLTSLNISKNTELTTLYCSENPGDRVSKFPVTAWFDNATVPGSLEVHTPSWEYNGNTITIDFQKAQ